MKTLPRFREVHLPVHDLYCRHTKAGTASLGGAVKRRTVVVQLSA